MQYKVFRVGKLILLDVLEFFSGLDLISNDHVLCSLSVARLSGDGGHHFWWWSWSLASSSSILLRSVSMDIVLQSQDMTQGPYLAPPTLTRTLKLWGRWYWFARWGWLPFPVLWFQFFFTRFHCETHQQRSEYGWSDVLFCCFVHVWLLVLREHWYCYALHMRQQ
jgi:hypothetical protein